MSQAVNRAMRRFSQAVRYTFWVVPYELSRVPGDTTLRYRAFDAQRYPTCREGCRHVIPLDDYRAAKVAAIVQHRRGIGCEGVA